MSNYSQRTKHDTEYTNGEDFFEGMSNEMCEFFKGILFDAEDADIRKIEEETKNMEISPPSRRHKIRMNRLFRERVGGSFLPFPEEDNFYEKVRSNIVIKLLKIKEFINIPKGDNRKT